MSIPEDIAEYELRDIEKYRQDAEKALDEAYQTGHMDASNKVVKAILQAKVDSFEHIIAYSEDSIKLWGECLDIGKGLNQTKYVNKVEAHIEASVCQIRIANSYIKELQEKTT